MGGGGGSRPTEGVGRDDGLLNISVMPRLTKKSWRPDPRGGPA